eukprot:jgi/Psemu1/16628/gm1.16628_g
MASSSSSPREVIQVSLGPSANAITAHLLNLQGLSATSPSSSDDIYCDPATTHYVQSSRTSGGGTLVPRVLMIDESTHNVPATMTEAGDGTATSTSLFDGDTTNLYADSFWNGQIQVLGNDTLGWNNIHYPNDSSANTSPFWNAASSMAYSSYSRYHQSRDKDYSGHEYRADPSNSRQVVWDDDEEEDEEDPYERLRREEQNERRWKTQTSVALGQELDRLMDEEFQHERNDRTSEEAAQSSSTPTREFFLDHWTDIWMPPRDEKSRIVLPFSSQSQLVPHWNASYQCDGNNAGSTLPFLQEWKEDALFENVRHMLESCDYGIQGISIATEGHGIYASLATYLLDELKQECKSAGRLIYHVTDEFKTNETETVPTPRSGRSDNSEANFSVSSSTSWQEAQVDRIRQQMSLGLALCDFSEKAHAILPLRLSGKCDLANGSSSSKWFRATARVAMALEASTLPFRLNGKNHTTAPGRSPMYQIGLQNAPFMASDGSFDTSWGSTARRLTFSEYLQVLQPSSSYSMLELDVLSQNIDNRKLYDFFREGTSVERDQRMRESRGHTYFSRPRDVSPGAWMQDARQGTARTGLLTSISYCNADNSSNLHLDRSLHHHFSLSTSVRAVLSKPSDNNEGISMPNYMTCLVQGMGIQYRPERSMATVLNQSLKQLTFGAEGGGSTYAAGIYWKHVLPKAEVPVVAVLGNTTRAFASLDKTASDMKAVMRTPRFRGYYNRDVSNGVLPEMEDCDEALEACFNKRDVYRPPSGSGFDGEEDY